MQTQNINWEGKTILVAEDDISSFKMVEMLLSQANAKVIWAETGEEALFFVKHPELKIDAVLMDVQMPDLDGIEATKLLKANHPHLPVIMLSSYVADPNYAENTHIFDARVAKPIHKDKLIGALQFCFEHVAV